MTKYGFKNVFQNLPENVKVDMHMLVEVRRAKLLSMGINMDHLINWELYERILWAKYYNRKYT